MKYLQKINNNLRYCGNKLLRSRTFFAHSHVLPKKFARQDHFTQIFAQLTKRLGTAELTYNTVFYLVYVYENILDLARQIWFNVEHNLIKIPQ